MIQIIEAVSVDCDNCKEVFEAPYTGFTIFGSPEQAFEEIIDANWIITDNEVSKTYCPKCQKLLQIDDSNKS